MGGIVRPFAVSLLVAVCALSFAGSASAAPVAKLRAGAGQADITPPQTGYPFGGWIRADRVARGQSTRLFANTLVLERGSKKIALVAVELFAFSAGVQEDVARKVADLGFDKTTVLLAASHTHSGPTGFDPNPRNNTVAPSINTITDPLSFVRLLDPKPADRQLYTFLVNQIAQSIRRADGDRAPAEAAWGHSELIGVTQNRSIESHLAVHGIHVPFGKGSPAMDPDGPVHTIDPGVDVLRVDKVVRRADRLRRVPIGAYSNFADHGTVVHSETEAYSGDHHATAWREFVDRVRKASDVPRRQTVVNVYPNGAEGDQTAGIVNVGPAAAVRVGAQEARAMFGAWRDAGTRLSRTPELDVRWTRTCFCGRSTATGPVDSEGRVGVPFATGSEEGRGPLYDQTKTPLEGYRSPVDDPVQGDKIDTHASGAPPPAVPVSVWRVGDGVLAGVPGEPTKEVGVRIRSAVLGAMAGSGVTHVVIAGLAGEYIQYVTTPEEYGEQSYEGASTLYGKNEATFFQERLAELGRALAGGQPAPAPYPLDTSFGLRPDGPAFPPGAASGTITRQPEASVPRMRMAHLAWTGGPSGHDRPVDRAFITAQRLVGKRWRNDDSDLAIAMLWRVDDQGRYTLEWEPAATLPTGTYRFRVTATRYELLSQTFRVTPATSLRRTAAGRLAYPPARANIDLLPAPPDARAFPAGDGRWRDRYGNTT